MRRALVFLMLQLLAAAAPAATRIDLNGEWMILREPNPAAITEPPLNQLGLSTFETADIPHSWNRVGAHYDYLGAMWYFKFFDGPVLNGRDSAQLHFGATFYKSRVFVNGVEVGGHEGGYTAYSLDVTKQLHTGRKNSIAVLVDNRPGPYTIPGFGARGAPDAWYDWWAYGGITRDVWLEAHGPGRIDNQLIRSKIEGNRAIVSNRVRLTLLDWRDMRLRAYVTSADGKQSVTHERKVPPTAGTVELTIEVAINDFQRWDLDHPNLYRMRIELTDANGQVIDDESQDFGVRSLEIRDRTLLLNGARVRLTGMTRHADSPWEGAAETRGTILHDWDDMKSLNMTLTRPVHYSQDPRVFDYADEHGILLIPEIPVWQASEQQLSNPQYLELAKNQYRELIEQYGNHPSVFAWSVMNESAAGTPGGIKFFRAMRDYIKSLDPGRPVTLADDNLPKLKNAAESAANDADFLMMNEYFGAWHGPREALGPALDKVNALFPDKMVIISEMGYPGIFAKNPADADPTRVSILREQLPELAKRDWIAGAILWCYQDYKSRRYFWPGQEGGYLEHGIVDENRQRKPSYFAWKELNEPADLKLQWENGVADQIYAFSVRLTPHRPDQLPYLPLRDYQVTWQLTGAENRAFASGSRPVEGDAALMFGATVPARDTKQPFRLVVKLLRPDGSVAMERALASQ